MRDTVGSYRLLDALGDDRLGQRYRARDTEHGRTVLVRIVHPAIADDPVQRARLVNAANAATAVSHPAVAALYEVIDTPAEVALAHEHVDGRTLAATLGGHALNPRAATAIAIQLADGLAELHAAGITHGVVNAEHVMITPRGQAKLLDAGVASEPDPIGAVDDDLAALGRLLQGMTGSELPKEAWASDLTFAIARTRPGHAKRYQSLASLASDLRGISVVLETRAEAVPPAALTREGGSALLWLIAGLLLLLVGVWMWSR